MPYGQLICNGTLYLDNRRLLGYGLEFVIEDPKAYDIQAQAQKDFLHICHCLHGLKVAKLA